FPPEQGRPHNIAHHPLPGRGRSPVRAHCHAQAGPAHRARHHRSAAGAGGRPRSGRRIRALHAGRSAGERGMSSTPIRQRRDDMGSGFPTLLRKEVQRFWKVGFQTIAAPVLTALLYLLIFAHVLEDRVQVYDSVPYTAFLIPGLMMMSMLQNAFANPSSSLIQSRITGNLVFILLPPLSHLEIYGAYLLASIARGLCCGVGVWLVALFVIDLPVHHAGWLITFAVLSCGVMGNLDRK